MDKLAQELIDRLHKGELDLSIAREKFPELSDEGLTQLYEGAIRASGDLIDTIIRENATIEPLSQDARLMMSLLPSGGYHNEETFVANFVFRLLN